MHLCWTICGYQPFCDQKTTEIIGKFNITSENSLASAGGGMNRPDLKILGRSDGFYFCPSFFWPKRAIRKTKMWKDKTYWECGTDEVHAFWGNCAQKVYDFQGFLVCSPHTRGCTCSFVRLCTTRLMFPAYAGMHSVETAPPGAANHICTYTPRMGKKHFPEHMIYDTMIEWDVTITVGGLDPLALQLITRRVHIFEPSFFAYGGYRYGYDWDTQGGFRNRRRTCTDRCMRRHFRKCQNRNSPWKTKESTKKVKKITAQSSQN